MEGRRNRKVSRSLVRANREKIEEDLIIFGRSKERIRVFLEVDGEKTVNQIAGELKMKVPNVSRRITELKNEGLIRIKKITSGGYIIYEKAEKVKILDLEQKLRRKLINPNDKNEFR